MFEILEETENYQYRGFLKAAERHLEGINGIRESLVGVSGQEFVQGYINVFSRTGSPYVVNLDLNASGFAGDLDLMVSKSKEITKHMKKTVLSTRKHVSGYKMNEQSMLTFLIAGEPKLIENLIDIYSDGVGTEPLIWTDEKLRDIPSTTYQTAKIIYALGYKAIHCMPQIGPDVAGALQLAADELGGRGTVHVINLTHDGYDGYVKREYFKDPVGTIDLMRENALGNLTTEVDVGDGKKHEVIIRATGTIEPANRPDEIFQGLEDIYENRIMIISIGIGPQGALPGTALYSGATIEGIGRFIFRGKGGFEAPEVMEKKSRLCKRSCLLALDARYSETPEPYPLEEIMKELAEFDPSIRETTREGLDRVYQKREKRKGERK